MGTVLRILKWVAIALASVAGLAGFVIAGWWLQPDEALNPEAEKLMALRPAPPAARNAYFMFLALDAPAGLDAHVVGQEIAAEHARRVEALEAAPLMPFSLFMATNPSSFNGNPRLKVRGPYPMHFCDIAKQNCLAAFQGIRPQIEAHLALNDLMLDRYVSIRNYPEFHEPITSGDAGLVLSFSKFVDASIAWRVAAPATREAALIELAAEITSWRRILRECDSLLTLHLSSGHLYRKYRLASEIMAAYPVAVREYPAIFSEITSPLPVGEANLLRVLKGEFRLAAQAYRFEGKEDDPGMLMILAKGYRPNATINLYFKLLSRRLQLYAKPPGEILEGHADLEAVFDPVKAGTLFYNPVGKLEAYVWASEFSSYSFALHDLVGYSRLLDLQRRMAEGNIEPKDSGELIADAGPELADPYTGRRMDLDATAGALSFPGHGRMIAKGGKVAVVLVRQ